MNDDLNIIIMAGGLGKRMESDLPKVLHKILNKPLIVHVIEESVKLIPKKIMIVVGKYRDIIKKTIDEYLPNVQLIYVYQPEALGTGHAIQCCANELKFETYNTTLVLSGDVPFLKYETMTDIIKDTNKVKIAVTELEDSTGYGRIILKDLQFEKIIEEKDCSVEQKKIKQINCGIYSFNTKILCKYLPCLSNNNAQKEYYLTDIIEIIKINEGIDVQLCNINKDKHYQIMGINTKQQLLELERLANPI
jgi:UDP-N-acetylglucosamine diphosphorylase/glucosamine-1-phosphate N-acetyltransferase